MDNFLDFSEPRSRPSGQMTSFLMVGSVSQAMIRTEAIVGLTLLLPEPAARNGIREINPI
ncbi:MAG: hypothetical protein CMJ78_08820 [Planctomycetaceae bacterium]|nr:hypothetical protein [Planctomycetaceae bacterium]